MHFSTTTFGLALVFYTASLQSTLLDAAPQREFEITVDSGEVQLAATLICPDGDGPFACVVLTHGSEPGVRDWYRRAARLFLDRNIATLLYDKRGCGKSTGEYVEAPDLNVPASDLIACVATATQHPLIDAKRIGVWGVSQGGWVGPLAASQSDSIRFVIMISGPSISPLEQNLYDKGNQLRPLGLSEEEIDQVTKVRRLVWTYLTTGENRTAAQEAWNAAQQQPWFEHVQNGPPMGDRDQLLKHPRLIHFAAHSGYDPVPALQKLDVPVLAIYGDADSIVPAQRCADILRSLFAGERESLLTLRIFDDADHGIRVTEQGERVFAPGYHDLVLDWTEEVVAKIGAVD